MNGASFQNLDKDGVPICVPMKEGRRTIHNIGHNDEKVALFDAGYDSDGYQGPFYDAVMGDKELDHYYEDNVREDQVEAPSAASPQLELPAQPEFILTKEYADTLKVSELKTHLGMRGLSKSGVKRDLLARLHKAIDDNVPVIDRDSTTTVVTATPSDPLLPNDKDGWHSSPKWMPLVQNPVPLNDDRPDWARPPTEPHDMAFIPHDYFNFNETFDRPLFKETSPVWQRTISKKNDRVRKDGRGNARYFSCIRDKGCASVIWMEKHGLGVDSSPVDWINALFKIEGTNAPYPSLFHQWNAWTNVNAILGNVGLGGIYPNFTPFSVDEIKSHLALYILNGLNISPRVEWKFRSQCEDPVNGSDLCYDIFGKNSTLRHREFKNLFAIQDPVSNVSPRSLAPNHKVDCFFLTYSKCALKHLIQYQMCLVMSKMPAFKGGTKTRPGLLSRKQGMGSSLTRFVKTVTQYPFTHGTWLHRRSGLTRATHLRTLEFSSCLIP